MADQVTTDQLRGFIEDDFGGASPEDKRPAALVPLSTVVYDSFGSGKHWQCVRLLDVNTWVPLGGASDAQITFALINRVGGVVNPNTMEKVLTDGDAKILAEIIDIQLAQFAPHWPSLKRARCRFMSAEEEPQLASQPNTWPIYLTNGVVDFSGRGFGGLHWVQNSLFDTFVYDGLGNPIGAQAQPYFIPGRPVGYVAAVRYYNYGIGGSLVAIYPPAGPFNNFTDPLYPFVVPYFISTAGVIGHEAMEMLGDPYADTYVAVPPYEFCEAGQVNYSSSAVVSEGAPFLTVSAFREIVDPVQKFTYPLGPVHGVVADVTNFTTANWWRLDWWMSQNLGFGADPAVVPTQPISAFSFQWPPGEPPPLGTLYDYMGITGGPFDIPFLGAVFFTGIATTGRGLTIAEPPYQNPQLFAPPYTGVNAKAPCPTPPDPPNAPLVPLGPGEARVELPAISFGLYGIPTLSGFFFPGLSESADEHPVAASGRQRSIQHSMPTNPPAEIHPLVIQEAGRTTHAGRRAVLDGLDESGKPKLKAIDLRTIVMMSPLNVGHGSARTPLSQCACPPAEAQPK